MRHDRHPNDDKHIWECADVGEECEPTVKVWAQPPLGLAGYYCKHCFKFYPKEQNGAEKRPIQTG